MADPHRAPTSSDGSHILGLPMLGAGSVSSDADMKRAVHSVLGEVADPHFRATVEQTLREMSAGSGASTAGGGSAADPVADGHLAASVFSTLASQSGAAGADAIANTLGMLGRLSEDGGGGDAAAATEGLSDALIAKMMSEFETMGGKDDFAQVTDGMMRQLLSKDIMYVPLRSIAERFPGWLAKHTNTITEDEYNNYGRMYQTFQKLVLTYEIEPDNFPRVLELFNDLQESGNPPVEIIKDLAPGLELGADGMPAMAPCV